VALALGSLAVIEGPGGGTVLDADHGRGVEDALQLSVVSLIHVYQSASSRYDGQP